MWIFEELKTENENIAHGFFYSFFHIADMLPLSHGLILLTIWIY